MANEKRFIDANECPCNTCRTYHCGEPRMCTNFMMWLHHRKPVDAVEVVRCKDCKYWVEEKDLGLYCSCWCGMMSETVADDFCSYGERR